MKNQAFIFDLDGVLTDTAEFHFQAWKALAENLDVEFTRADNEKLKGVGRIESLNAILEKGELKLSKKEKINLCHKKNKHYQELISEMTPNDVFTGVLPLFHALRQRHILIGLASASKNALQVLQQLQLMSYFDFVADANKVASKPAPDIFLMVAEALHVQPQDCVGIEDAVAGIQAITSANMFAVGIGEKRLLSQANLVFSDMQSFDLENVLESAPFSTGFSNDQLDIH